MTRAATPVAASKAAICTPPSWKRCAYEGKSGAMADWSRELSRARA
jgi:hypothetical protein